MAAERGGKRNGQGWIVCCPAHEDKNPSLSICDGDNGSLVVHCFAGCDPVDVLKALKADSPPLAPKPNIGLARAGLNASNRHTGAMIWNMALPAPGTPVEAYIRSRGYTDDIPPTLRHHPALKHAATGLKLHAMVAAVTKWPSREAVAVHRTYLKDNGSGKSPVEPNKMMLGSVKGGAVRLAPAAERMAVTEGIETGLSVQQATGIATWAALSACGIENLILPDLPLGADIVIAADNDASGRGLAAAEIAARRWTAEGRTVRIALPQITGSDFNDVLLEGVR